MTDDERDVLIERVRRERVAQGLPERIEDEGLHRLLGHIMATHAERD